MINNNTSYQFPVDWLRIENTRSNFSCDSRQNRFYRKWKEKNVNTHALDRVKQFIIEPRVIHSAQIVHLRLNHLFFFRLQNALHFLLIWRGCSVKAAEMIHIVEHGFIERMNGSKHQKHQITAIKWQEKEREETGREKTLANTLWIVFKKICSLLFPVDLFMVKKTHNNHVLSGRKPTEKKNTENIVDRMYRSSRWICVFIKVHETKKMYRNTATLRVQMEKIDVWCQGFERDTSVATAQRMKTGRGKKDMNVEIKIRRRRRRSRKNNTNNWNGNGGDWMRSVSIICSACLGQPNSFERFARLGWEQQKQSTELAGFYIRYWIFVCECWRMFVAAAAAIFRSLRSCVLVECKQTALWLKVDGTWCNLSVLLIGSFLGFMATCG